MKRSLLWTGLTVIAVLAMVHLTQRQLAGVWSALGVRPELASELRESMDDQKRLSELDPSRSAHYRERFERLRALHNRVNILRYGQGEMIRTQERILFAVIAVTLLVIAASYFVRRRREVIRLQRIREFVERLSAGESRLRVGETGGDAIARIARMIEHTSDVVGADRERLRYLENLSAWQEAARRHAHEIRTPLTAAQLELERMEKEIGRSHPGAAAALALHRSSISEELERLRQFTRSFTSFAAIGQPQLTPTNLLELLREFRDTFSGAWPLELQVDAGASGCIVDADRAMLRQVIVNLCSNSALASDGSGSVLFNVRHERGDALIDVTDSGSGIPDEIRSRLFQPYATTRRRGEGMGLGLSISKKIMLDQGGDLLLGSTSPSGTTFTLALPCRSHEGPA